MVGKHGSLYKERPAIGVCFMGFPAVPKTASVAAGGAESLVPPYNEKQYEEQDCEQNYATGN